MSKGKFRNHRVGGAELLETVRRIILPKHHGVEMTSSRVYSALVGERLLPVNEVAYADYWRYWTAGRSVLKALLRLEDARAIIRSRADTETLERPSKGKHDLDESVLASKFVELGLKRAAETFLDAQDDLPKGARLNEEACFRGICGLVGVLFAHVSEHDAEEFAASLLGLGGHVKRSAHRGKRNHEQKPDSHKNGNGRKPSAQCENGTKSKDKLDELLEDRARKELATLRLQVRPLEDGGYEVSAFLGSNYLETGKGDSLMSARNALADALRTNSEIEH